MFLFMAKKIIITGDYEVLNYMPSNCQRDKSYWLESPTKNNQNQRLQLPSFGYAIHILNGWMTFIHISIGQWSIKCIKPFTYIYK